jgi:hypothetical protein
VDVTLWLSLRPPDAAHASPRLVLLAARLTAAAAVP